MINPHAPCMDSLPTSGENDHINQGIHINILYMEHPGRDLPEISTKKS